MTSTAPPATESTLRTPRWVWGIILALALIEPTVHLGIVLFPPSGAVPTGLHVVDSASWLTAMRHCLGDRESPYACRTSIYGTHHPSLFAIPHYYLYGLVGVAGRWLRIPEFHALALANGGGLAFMLWAAYRLLRRTVPVLASRAFLLFALGGGLGGGLYLACAAAGVTQHPHFPDYFLRHFLYELNEGTQFQLWLLASRLYYTIPMGLGFIAFAGLARAFQTQSWRPYLMIVPALALACFINARFAPIYALLTITWLLMWGRHFCLPKVRIGSVVLMIAGIVLGAVPAAYMALSRPELIQSIPQNANASLWVTAFLSAVFFHLWIVPSALARALREVPKWLAPPAWALFGYATAFLLLIMGYYAYYGNLLRCYDATAAVRVSDWALWGALGGLVLGIVGKSGTAAHDPSDHPRIMRIAVGRADAPGRRSMNHRRLLGILAFFRQPGASALPTANFETDPPPLRSAGAGSQLSWYALWFLGFFCLAISATGHGRLLELSPGRFKVVLGLPLAVLAADTLERWRSCCPRVAHAYTALIVVAGLASMGVAWGVSHGPLGYHSLQRQFPWTANLYMSAADAHLIACVPEGVVLAPSLGSPLFGDVIAQLPGHATVFGNPTIDFSREFMPEVRTQVAEFFQPGATEASRRALIEKWKVDSVYCSDTAPVDPAVIAELRALPWLREIASEGRGVVLSVLRSQ